MTSKSPKLQIEEVSVLAGLRALGPGRGLTVDEALQLAEVQAVRLLACHSVRQTPVGDCVITDQPRIAVDYDFDMPSTASGASHWDGSRRRWVITINAHQAQTRQRFTLMHEYKHILDHGRPALREPVPRLYYGLPAVEFVADFFAGCALMPRVLVKRAWGAGVQSVTDLALRFDVSERAMTVRLAQLRLIPDAARSGGREGNNRMEQAA